MPPENDGLMIPVFVKYFIPQILQFAKAISNYGFSGVQSCRQLAWYGLQKLF
jgi:hypothetical protein